METKEYSLYEIYGDLENIFSYRNVDEIIRDSFNELGFDYDTAYVMINELTQRQKDKKFRKEHNLTNKMVHLRNS